MESVKLRILVIDNDVTWVKKLTMLINQEDDMVVVGTSNLNGSDCELVRMMNPNIILLDVFWDNSRWKVIEMIQSFRLISDAKIIVFTTLQDPEMVKATLFAGAKEYIIKENVNMLLEIIRVIAKRWSAAEIMARAADEFGKIVIAKRKDDILSGVNLTPSERRIFYCLERRLTRGQIARELDISENTVKNHVSNILNKIEVDCAKEAVDKINKMI